MSGVKRSSREAYEHAVLEGRTWTQWDLIEATMAQQAVPLTRRMLVLLTGLPINVITPRIAARLEDKERPFSGLTKDSKPARVRVVFEAVDLPDVPPVEWLELIVSAPPERLWRIGRDGQMQMFEVPAVRR